MHTKYDDLDDFAFSDNPSVVRLMRKERWEPAHAKARKAAGPGDDDDFDDEDFDDYGDYDEEEFDRYSYDD